MHFELPPCEGRGESTPSSMKRETAEESGCIEGILVEIEQAEPVAKKSEEVCLVDEEGEELNLVGGYKRDRKYVRF